MSRTILRAENITKGFTLPDKSRLVILQDLFLEVGEGSIVSVTGASGSGKSTLLHLLGSLDKPDAGSIYFADQDIARFDAGRLCRYRNRDIGFVFQFHYLMPELTVLENVAAPYLLGEFDRERAETVSLALLADVGLEDRSRSWSYQLSGGERQRAAIARGLVNSPRLLLADEPTGNLDWKTGEQVFRLFARLIRDKGLTAVVVTHNPQVAALTDCTYLLQDGRLQKIR